MVQQPVNRRNFMKTIPAVAGALSLTSSAAQEKSKVVEIHRPGIVGVNNRPDPVGVQEMLDKVMREISGQKSTRDQWAKYISKDDVVGLKVNGRGGPHMSTKTELIEAVIKRLMELGVKENNIIIWDDRQRCIRSFGRPENMGDTGIRVCRSDHPSIGWDEQEVMFNGILANISKILTQYTTVMINMPLMKDHTYAGTTLSLKNISHGITNSSSKFHSNHCNPYIAEINTTPVVHQKYRITIMDGFRGCFDKGPNYNPAFACNYESLYVAIDRVAMDAVCSPRIEATRQKHNLLPLSELGRPTNYIADAHRLGLGNNEIDKIDHIVLG